MFEHTTIHGQTVRIENLPTELSRHYARATACVEDPKVSYEDMQYLVYGLENPLAEYNEILDAPYLSKQSLANPFFWVLVDLLDRKRIQLGELDLDYVLSKYTLDVPTVAADLSVSQQEVLNAIQNWKLGAMLKNNQWWIRPDSLALYKLSKEHRARTMTPAVIAPATHLASITPST